MPLAGPRAVSGSLCFALACCLLASVATASGAERQAPARRPNVLFILSDDQRPDTIHALGNTHIRTPNLDSLVSTGTTFTRAMCPYPLCVPSRAAILTGCSGFRNGILPGYTNKLNPAVPKWPRVMRDAGYHTWYVGKWHTTGRPSTWGYSESLGLFAGGLGKAPPRFDHKGRKITGYHGWVFQPDDRQVQPEKGIGLTANISAAFADAAIEFIRRRPEKPFFLHVNFTAPHDPLIMPPGYEGMYDPKRIPLPPNFLPEHPFDHGNLRGRDEQLLPWPRTPENVREELAVYYAIISHMDEQIGRILAALDDTGQAKDTIVIFASDHGLAIGSHGLRGKQNMYEHTVGVPLIFRGPRIPKSRRTDAQAYLRDIFPTVCELVGLRVPDSIDSRSLAPVIRGEAKSVREEVFGYFVDAQRMIRTDRWKLIEYPKINKRQLFALPNDPQELRNLADDPQHAEVMVRLQRRLKAWQKKVGDPLADP